MMKRVISALLIVAMVVIPFTAIAADYDNHWVKADADYLIKAGILVPDNGNIKPDELMIRGEFVTLVNKVFNFTEKDTNGFTDVPAGSKYFDAFAAAKKAGYIKGNEQGEAKPNDNIVRGEVAVILARVSGLANGTKTYPEADVQGWAAGAVAALDAAGIMKGYEDGTFKGYNNISNAEGYALAARLLRAKAPAATVAPTVAPATPAPALPTPALSNDKGYMIYDTFEGTTKLEDSGWKPLTVEEGNYSSANKVFTDNNTPGIGAFIFGVRTSGGGTGGGMYKIFPRLFQVLQSIPAEVDEKPAALPNGSIIVVEYDIKMGVDADKKRIQGTLRTPFGIGDSTPLSAFYYGRDYHEGRLGFGTTDKQNLKDITPDPMTMGQWYRFRQEIHVTNDAGAFGENLDFYVNGVKTLENQKYCSTSGSKMGVLGAAMFSTTAWQTTLGSPGTGIAIDNFTVYIGSSKDLTANKGVLIATLRQGAAKIKSAKSNAGEAPGQYAPALVSAATAAMDNATSVYNDYKADQAATDKALADFNAALAGLVANK